MANFICMIKTHCSNLAAMLLHHCHNLFIALQQTLPQAHFFHKGKLFYRYLKQGIQELHRKYVKAANNVVSVWRLHYINTLIHELGSTKTYERISTDERSIVNTHSIDITAEFAVGIKENQDKLRYVTLYWLPKLHKRPYKARLIANSSSCTTTILSKLLTSCLTAVKKTD